MTEITASMVSQLREKSGSGMMNCKKALKECNGDMEAATEWLRKQGLAAASKKSDRGAAEGLVAVKSIGNRAVVLELNAETDFVGKNDRFQKLASDLVGSAIDFSGNLEEFKKDTYPNSSSTVTDVITENIAVIGENINLRRMNHLQVQQGLVATYVHNAVADGMGKIGVLVAIESSAPKEKLAGLGKNLAMHIAALSPKSLSIDQLDPELVNKERSIFQEQLSLSSDKPPVVIDKIIEGKMRKLYEELVLLEQVFALDNKIKVSRMIADASSEFGVDVKITGFMRYKLGEGIEKKEGDFAAEVQAMVK